MKLTHLRTNHMTNPVIDKTPEFSWRIESDDKNVLQHAYRIVVKNGKDIVWDSGKIEDRQQSFVKYGGAALSSRTEYVWEVSVWDNLDNMAVEDAKFETAFLDIADWKAVWSESTIERNESKWLTYGIENPAIMFRRKFTLKDAVKSARLYATCYGVYRPFMNNQRLDDREFAPEFTPYDKILNYQCYDVSKFVQKGENDFSMLVGDGWYFCAQTAVVTSTPRPAPSVLFQLEVEYTNGTTDIFYSDGSETCEKSNIIFSDLFMGEKVNMMLPYGAPQKVVVKDYGYDMLRIQPMPPVKAIETFPAKEVYVSPNGETIVDFGQVIAGRIRVNINAPKETEISFEHTEVVDRDKNYFATTILRQCDTYISDGKPCVFEPAFTFHGFRYVRVTGMENVRKEDFTAVLLSTEKDNAAEFSCSDERFNRLYKNIRYSQKNNMLSIPTDCPTREKAGWLGDVLIYIKAALFNEEMTPFFNSWLDGVVADQLDNGVTTLISPYTNMYQEVVRRTVAEFGDNEHTGIAGWSDAIVWVPYAMWQVTGDINVLKKYYEPMKRWCDYIIRTAAEKRGSNLPEEIDKYLWNTGFHFGEWLVPGRPSEGFEICKETSGYIAPFYGYRTISMMGEIAEVLGHKEAVNYKETAGKMKKAIQEGIFKNDLLPNYLQGGYVLAFAFDLVPEDLYGEYKNRLVSLVEKSGNRLGTGFLAVSFILDALEKIGRKDLAKAILWQNESPSWLFEVEQGATTIWEHWEGMDKEGNPKKISFDHYAFGIVDEWIMRRVCGIDSKTPGFSHILIDPQTDYGFDWCKRIFICEAGEIYVSWNKDKLEVKIPCNTTATVTWKGKKHEVGSGEYYF